MDMGWKIFDAIMKVSMFITVVGGIEFLLGKLFGESNGSYSVLGVIYGVIILYWLYKKEERG